MAKHNKSNTSKTARVMNLLSKKTDPVTEPESEESVEQGVPAESASPVPPILSSIESDAAVSGQIKDALEEALVSDLAVEEAKAAPPAEEPAPEKKAAAPAVEAEVKPEEPSVEASAEEPEPAASGDSKTAVSAEDLDSLAADLDEFQKNVVNAPAAPAAQPIISQEVTPPVQAAEPEESAYKVVNVTLENALAEEKKQAQNAQNTAAYEDRMHVGYVNVMQVLVEEKAPKYAKMVGLCGCDRCLEDMKALTLNNLPSKYVVMEQGEMIPKLTFYEGKYNSDITAQLLKAAAKVMEHPHHTRF